MDKPFRTIDEQIDILKSRGVVTDNSTAEILSREGYYSIVNGYKDLYLDQEATKDTGEDVYYEGTRFQDIYRLYLFDRSLRQLFFRYFAMAETTLKSQCAYHFMDIHGDEHEPYLAKSNYNKNDQYRVKWLIEEFELALGKNPDKKPKKKAYLDHYKKNHDEVPLWVLLQYATLGQTFKFYCYQNESMKNKISKGFAELYAQSYGKKINISPKRLTKAYDHIKDFRNICAHEERLYCARVSPSQDISITDALSDLRLTLSKDNSDKLKVNLSNLLVDLSNDMDSHCFNKLIQAMGIQGIQDLLI